mgnify:CR=1 FL=1
MDVINNNWLNTIDIVSILKRLTEDEATKYLNIDKNELRQLVKQQRNPYITEENFGLQGEWIRSTERQSLRSFKNENNLT